MIFKAGAEEQVVIQVGLGDGVSEAKGDPDQLEKAPMGDEDCQWTDFRI